MVINIVQKEMSRGRNPQAARSKARKMIKKKKPVAARGKTTKKEATKRKLKKAMKSLAMGAPAALAKRVRSVPPGMKKAMTGSATGMGGAGLMAMAKKIKKDGEISPRDLMRMKAAISKKPMKRGGKAKK